MPLPPLSSSPLPFSHLAHKQRFSGIELERQVLLISRPTEEQPFIAQRLNHTQRLHHAHGSHVYPCERSSVPAHNMAVSPRLSTCCYAAFVYRLGMHAK